MSPRCVGKPYFHLDLKFKSEDHIFFMLEAGNRDEEHFDYPDRFNPYRDTSKAITLGAGPHFCAGAWAAKSLIVNVALPMIFETMPFM